MVKGCGMKCVKYSLFAFNMVFWLIGCALLAVGIWFLVDSQQFLKYAENTSVASSDTLILGLGIGVVVVGSIIMITGFLGCCGAVRESECMLALFFSILIVIFAVMVAIGVIAIVHQDWIKEFVKGVMDYEVTHNTTDGILKWSHDEWGCCGVESTTTCKESFPPADVCVKGTDKCSSGCLDALWENMMLPMANGAGIAMLVTCVVLIFGMVFSMCLCCKVH